MFGKFQDSLLFVVLAYAIFRIGWGEGFTTMNIFILLGSLVAFVYGASAERLPGNGREKEEGSGRKKEERIKRAARLFFTCPLRVPAFVKSPSLC